MNRAILMVSAILAITVFATGLIIQSVEAQPEVFRAILDGDKEVPPVDTKAIGLAIFQLNKDGTTIDYKLIVANIEDVTQAHLHCNAPEGTNGPVSVFLFGFVPGGGTENGILAQGSITDEFTGACDITDVNDLLEGMRTGETYVNVHTVNNPPGEIRGQIVGPPLR